MDIAILHFVLHLFYLQHVQSTLTSWSDELNRCHLIFYRAASSNQTILFGGKTPIFDKTDFRLRSIPFPTRRATLKEVKRVWLALATIEIRGIIVSQFKNTSFCYYYHLYYCQVNVNSK